jgi:hypothetical protein
MPVPPNNAKTETVDCKFVVKEGTAGPFLAIELLGNTPSMLVGMQLSLKFRKELNIDSATQTADELNKSINRLSVLTFTSLEGLK